MTNKYMYFVANWKMFGDLRTLNSLDKVIKFSKNNKKNKFKIVYCPPNTLIRPLSRRLKKTKIEVIRYFRSNLDVIISDMAADTTGSKSLDAIRTNQLCSEVINFSREILKPKGVLVSKLFMGEDFIEVKNLAKSIFKKVNFFKPESSRKESKETYLHCEFLKTL